MAGEESWNDQGAMSVQGCSVFSPHGPLVELPSGKLAQTFYGDDGAGNYKLWVSFSGDDGVTWGNEVLIYSGASSRTETACAYVEGVADGSSLLVCVERGNAGHQFYSDDGGATWNDLGAMSVQGADGTRVSPWLLLYRGWLIWFYNDRGLKTFRYRVGRARQVARDFRCWGPPVDVYTSTVAVVSNMNGPVLCRYGGQLYPMFADGSERVDEKCNVYRRVPGEG